MRALRSHRIRRSAREQQLVDVGDAVLVLGRQHAVGRQPGVVRALHRLAHREVLLDDRPRRGEVGLAPLGRDRRVPEVLALDDASSTGPVGVSRNVAAKPAKHEIAVFGNSGEVASRC